MPKFVTLSCCCKSWLSGGQLCCTALQAAQGHDPAAAVCLQHGLHMGDHQGKLKGFPKIKRIVQRRGLASQHEDYHGDLGPDPHHDDHHEVGAAAFRFSRCTKMPARCAARPAAQCALWRAPCGVSLTT